MVDATLAWYVLDRAERFMSRPTNKGLRLDSVPSVRQDRIVDPPYLWYICTMPAKPVEDKGVINLRGVPVSLIRRTKAAAALEGKTLRIFVIEAIQAKIRKKQ